MAQKFASQHLHSPFKLKLLSMKGNSHFWQKPTWQPLETYLTLGWSLDSSLETSIIPHLQISAADPVKKIE